MLCILTLLLNHSYLVLVLIFKKRIMRKYFYLFIPLLLASCDEDNINFVPHNAVSEDNVLRTEADFKSAVLGAYAYMIKNGGADGYGSEFLIDSECMTDNVIVMNSGRGTNLDGYRYTSVASNSHFDYYDNAYRASNFAAKVINQINTLTPGASRDNLEGEARFIRALNHFDLVRIYGKIPTQSADANSSLGMPYFIDFTATSTPSRPTVAETYNQIINDLLIAKDLIGTANVVASGRANRTAVYALLSRVYLYMGDYPKVIEYGNLATNNATAAVCPRTQFTALWDDVNSSGVIFKLRIDLVDAVTPGVVFSQTTGQGIRSEFVVPQDFMAEFGPNTVPPLPPGPVDIRKTAYITTSAYAGNTYNHIIKYNGRPTGNPNIIDIKVLRVEEVYLNMAEAQYRIDGGGLVYLDKIRAQRYTAFTGGESGVALFDAIMKERRLELAFEMDRFFTLKRLGLSVSRSATIGDFANGGGTLPEASSLSLPAGSFKWQLPIPQYQRDLNRNLQQNPGY